MRSEIITPQITAGTVMMTAMAMRSDWKFAVSSRKITPMANSMPVCKPPIVSFSAGIWPRIFTVIPRGISPARAIALRISPEISPSGFPYTFAVRLTTRCML